ncbi:AraC family transcriptional regulator [Microlunatus parietis]|uniref:AraC-like DNA-binding protein n=1 Tax=Microlunatus parietis TaxID=682979 RepID=A0A7Y9I3F2_9ACTN|nr:AraC family transcriptional regulator [Microlunatus parietis]NYE69432.1 AraC-like DNA-binding protein [Microlunatus parietis]
MSGVDEVVRAQLDRLRLDLVVASRITRVPRSWARPSQPDPYSRLYLILSGEGLLRVGDTELSPGPGDLVYLPADRPVAYGTVSDDTYLKHWLHFSALIGDSDLGEVLELPYVVPSRDPKIAAGLFERVAAIDRDPPTLATPLRLRAALSELFGHYLESAPPGSVRLAGGPQPEGAGAFRRVVRFVDGALAESLTLDRLAAEAGLPPAEFARRFKIEFGLSPKQYVKRARIEHAQRELVDTDRPIEEIAADVGMDQSYFSRAFRQVSSITPSDYRRLYRP